VWEDDSQIDMLSVERRGVDRENPRAEIYIIAFSYGGGYEKTS
jgi:hypothetical protein